MSEIRVVAAVVTRDDRALICLRPAHKRHGNLWEFPGGKMEPGETLLQAADRELREELAVRVLSVGQIEFSIRDPGSPFRIEFLPVCIEGEPIALEHQEIAWVTAQELAELPLAPSDRAYAMFRRNGG